MNEIIEIVKTAVENYFSTDLPQITLTNIVDVMKYASEAFVALAYKYIEIIF